MSVKALRRKADNRLEHNLAQIAAQTSDLAKLRRAVEWVMSEARSMPPEQVPGWTERVCALAREMNERSRP